MPIITGSTITSFGKFSIESLSITNLNAFSVLDFSADPSLFDLDVESKFVSGEINQSSLNFKLSVKDPESLVLTNGGEINSQSFSGITVDLYTTGANRQLIDNLISDSNQTSFNFNSSDLADSIISFTGVSGLNNTRTFFLDFKTFDVAGNTDVYYALLRYPKAKIEDILISNSNPIVITPLSSGFDRLKNIDVYAVSDKDVVPDTVDGTFLGLISGYYSVKFDYEDFRSKQSFKIQSPSLSDNGYDIALPFNLVVIPNDYLGNGDYFLSSGIKTSFYNTEQVPYSIDNITGYINCTQNVFDKSLDIQAIAKWNAIRSDNPLSFEAYVYEDGEPDNSSYVFTCNNPKTESISSIAFGTGTGIVKNDIASVYYSGTTPIFDKFGTSGVKWQDHTLFIDNYYSLPLGLYSEDKKLKYITEVRIPSGVINSPEVYFVYGYNTGNNEFFILPSGGLYTGSIYTGTYSGYRKFSNLIPDLEFTYLGVSYPSSDPGLGNLTSDISLSSNNITQIYLDATDDNGFSVATWLSSVATYIKISKKNDISVYQILNVSNDTNEGGWLVYVRCYKF